MKFKKQYTDIYEKIQNDTKADLPESLQPEAIADLVKGKEVAPRKRHITTFASLAAAVVLVLAGVIGWRLLNDAPKPAKPIEPSRQVVSADLDDAYLRSATDYKEIEDYFAEKHAVMRKNNLYNGATNGEIYGAEGTGDDMAGIGSDSSAQDIAYGVTNTQVENIDEGDILKNDGNYLYFLHRETGGNTCLEIIDIRNRTALPVVARLSPPATESGKQAVAEELYVYDNTLVLVYTIQNADVQSDNYLERFYAYDALCERMKTVTAAAVYDITDRAAPVLTDTYAVDGTLLASRMDGTKLILSTNYSVPPYQNEETLKNACVPCYYTEGRKTRFAVNNVKIPAETDDTGYCTVSILDTADALAEPQMKAILGVDCQTVYCNGDTLLATRTELDIESFGDAVTVSNAHTRLYAFSLEEGIAYKGSAAVAGTTLNQFSLDAYNGYYRIATCEIENGSRVTVFNQNLELVGEISGIAKGENIYAVRFMGDTAYMVTFLQTDPLFVLDLSDPKNPAVTGILEIPGFSNYLHPYKENLLIGIGSEQTNNRSYVKISLFAVPDKENPQEISKLLYPELTADRYAYSSASDAQYDHKAYTTLRDTNEFALPIARYRQDGTDNFAITVTVENGELKITHTYTPQTAESENDAFLDYTSIRRITYRENVVYTLSDCTLTAFDRDSEEILCTYRFYTPEMEEAVK